MSRMSKNNYCPVPTFDFNVVLNYKLCKCIFQDKNVKTKKAGKKEATLRSDPTQAAEYYGEEQRYNTVVFLRRVFPSG